AAGFWLLTALLLWALSLPEATEASGLLRTLHDLVYVSGGPAHVVTLGLYLAAIAAAQWTTALLPRRITGLGAAAALLSIGAILALWWRERYHQWDHERDPDAMHGPPQGEERCTPIRSLCSRT